jgi:hypothetical protein
MSQVPESDTHKRIRLAIVRLEKGQPKVVNPGRKTTIAAVVEEAGVCCAFIHKDYPDLLERIRGDANKAIKSQRDAKNATLKKEREKKRFLRELIVNFTEQRDVLASKSASLELDNRRLTAMLSSQNVIVFRNKNPQNHN